MPRAAGVLAMLLLSACSASSGAGVPSGSPIAVVTPSTSTYCAGLNTDHPLVIAWLGYSNLQAVVLDVSDPRHAVTVCNLPSGSDHFIVGSLVAIWNLDTVSALDLDTGITSTLLTYDHNSGPVLSFDFSPDAHSLTYSRLTPAGT